jgi:hypothetical protein
MSANQIFNRFFSCILGLFLYAFYSTVSAHHGFGALFDTKQYVTLEGVISGFEFVNPHSYVYFQTTGDSGESTEYWCELNAQTQLRRKGISQDSFSVGDRIRIQGFVARKDPLGCYVASAQFADGSTLTLKNVSGNSLYSAPQVNTDTGIIGIWYPKGRGTMPRVGELVTQAGQAALDAYDSTTQNPVLRCKPFSPLRAWLQPGMPVEISHSAGTILIHHEFMDVQRVVHLDMPDHPNDVAPSDLGHSIGHFEGAGLVIETTNFAAGLLLETAQFSVGELVTKSPYTGMNTTTLILSERLTVNPDTGDLELTWTAEDPRYYTIALTGTRTMSRTDVELGTYNCTPTSGHAPSV